MSADRTGLFSLRFLILLTKAAELAIGKSLLQVTIVDKLNRREYKHHDDEVDKNQDAS